MAHRGRAGPRACERPGRSDSRQAVAFHLAASGLLFLV